MELLIFQTDITSKRKVKSLQNLLNNHSDILNWSVDLEDIDNVLRIEATDNLAEEDIIKLLNIKGYCIKALAD